MPTYEFRCPSGHDFEKFYRSIGAAPSEVRCPTCGEVASRQMSAGGGLVFKGSGFYITDYGKDGKKPRGPVSPVGETVATKGAGETSGSKSESSGGGEAGLGTSSAKPPGEAKPAAESKPATPPPSKKKTTGE